MKPLKVKITNYTKQLAVSIQYGNDPADYNYDLDTNAKKFAFELMRLIKQGATIEIETLEFKL